MGEDGWDVELRWGWGRNPRFSEVERFYVGDRGEIDGYVRHFITRMTRRYAFDCGRLQEPLNPCVYELVITPVGRREYINVSETYAALVEAEIEHTRTLIQRGDLYRGSGYNLEPAPALRAPEKGAGR